MLIIARGDGILGWHFVSADLRLQDGTRLDVGTTLKSARGLVLFKRGFHASARVIDALHHAPGPVICRVKLGGWIWRGTGIMIASQRTYLWSLDTEVSERLLHEFAISCAEQALSRIPNPDPRLQSVLEVKRRWLLGRSHHRGAPHPGQG
jgi:hypothetical protein